MPPKATPSEFPTQTFATPADFEAFLEREHATAPGVYVKLAKKSSGIPSITAAEAVEVALCYGWIDGRANACDDAFWTVRYTPRRAKSIWSQKNVGTVSRLIEDGRMRPAGLAAIDAAKADGRWDRAYAGSATIVTPDDLKDALARVPAAKAHWESMNKSDRYAALLRVETGTKNARSKRIQGIVQGLATGRRQGLRHFEPDFDSAGPEGCRHIINMPANIPSHTSSREAKRLDSFDKDGKIKTYNSGDSLVVTHLTTNPPVHCLYMAERTGSLIFSVLWSYV